MCPLGLRLVTCSREQSDQILSQTGARGGDTPASGSSRMRLFVSYAQWPKTSASGRKRADAGNWGGGVKEKKEKQKYPQHLVGGDSD